MIIVNKHQDFTLLMERLLADTIVADLDREAVRRVARSMGLRAAGRAQEGLLVAGPKERIRALRQIVLTAVSEGERDEQLMEILLGDVEPKLMGADHMLQLRMQAEARIAFVRHVALVDTGGQCGCRRVARFQGPEYLGNGELAQARR